MIQHRGVLVTVATLFALAACSPPAGEQAAEPPAGAAPSGQAAVQDNESMKDIAKVAAGSKDHTTLVAALTAADLVNSLANAGPFTVFAPTNAAFDKLPKGAVDELLKPANQQTLKLVLEHHVTTSVFDVDALADGQVLGMADGTNATITKKGADTFIDGAKIVGSVRASNGMVHVIDGVLSRPAK